MPKQRLRMREIKEILRLRYHLKRSQQDIAHATGVARSTVKDYLSRAKVANMTWPLPDAMDNEQLNALLFPPKTGGHNIRRPVPEWQQIHTELKRKSVTLYILWEEYKRANPDGYQYSWFARLYRDWAKTKDVWMPQHHKAGEKVFVDYSGLKVAIHTMNLQDIAFEAEIFVGVLGASDLIYCEASQTQQLSDWINSHQRMLTYYQGVPDLIVPDNLRSGVTQSNRYEPLCNMTYEEFAHHYDCMVMPTRTYSPKDKAKVEKAVQLVQQRILAALRHERFTSVAQLNKRISELLDALNHRYSKSYGCSRWELFNQVEREALRPLPETHYEFATWEKQRVNGGYHVCINQHYYSVPYQYVRKVIEIRITKNAIELFHNDSRIACHIRDDTPRLYTTQEAHRPESHRQHALWQSAERLQAWSESIGPYTQKLILQLFADSKRHLHQKERSALGILRLSHAYSDELLERACEKASAIGTWRYDSIVSLLKRQRLDMAPPEADQSYQTPNHDNVRGPNYYH